MKCENVVSNYFFIPCLMRCMRLRSTMLLCGGGGDGGRLSSRYMLRAETRRSGAELPAPPAGSNPLGGGESRHMYDLLLSPAATHQSCQLTSELHSTDSCPWLKLLLPQLKPDKKTATRSSLSSDCGASIGMCPYQICGGIAVQFGKIIYLRQICSFPPSPKSMCIWFVISTQAHWRNFNFTSMSGTFLSE